jgi:hypothetical protein
MVHSLGWAGQGEEIAGRKIGIVVGEYQLGYEFYESRMDCE